jgi:asparagine synthase (glutamine-hydrolysing)
MCGIYGIIGLDERNPSGDDLRAMANVLRHRGPDDQGSLICGPLAMGFQRLSIIDVAGGHQPMANEDATVWIVFNGEIYNHPELRLILEKRGHRYATQSDTETILHLYEEYGDACMDHLRGMFAFAIWDVRRKRLFCARDRVGIKPFYYTTVGGRFAFASEIKALLELPGFKARLNRRALPEFFALGYLSAEETLFEGVYKLAPGHCLSIDLVQDDHRPQVRQYWDLVMMSDSTPNGVSEQECLAQFGDLLKESVRIHLRSDVPLGVLLSGGLDSSALAAVASDLRKDGVQTFSVGYAEEGYSELSYARMVARHLGAQHHEVILSPDNFFASLPQLIWHEDEPLVWPSSVALHHVCDLAGKKVKVVLSGEGADEILAGYLKYRITLWNLRAGPFYRKILPVIARQHLRTVLLSGSLPDWIRRKLEHSFLCQPEAFEKMYFDNFYSVFPQDQQPELLTRRVSEELREISPYSNSMRFFRPGSTDTLNSLLYLDIKTYLVELLMKQDQMSMANSIESRVPFLDHKLVEFAARVPARYKVRHFTGKYLLRRAMAGRLPVEVLRRTKKGFPTPIRPWLRHQLFDKLQDVLTDGRMAEREVVRPEYVENLLRAHRHGISRATEACWRLLNFELWNRVFLDRDRSVNFPSRDESNAVALVA